MWSFSMYLIEESLEELNYLQEEAEKENRKNLLRSLPPGHVLGVKLPATLEWYPSDTKENFEKASKAHQEYWKNYHIDYKLNSYGFRCDEFPEKEEKESIAFLGCSVPFGIGVPKEYSFTTLLSKQMGLKEFNYSNPGGSLDCCYRLYKEWQPIHKSKYTVLMLPSLSRFEIVTPQLVERIGMWALDGMTENKRELMLDKFFNNSEIVQRAKKNLDAIKHIALDTESTLIIVNRALSRILPYFQGRDDIHPGIEWNERTQLRIKALIDNAQ